MKKSLAALALTGMVLASPAWAEKICLNIRDISGTTSKDGKVLDFKMRDGRVLHNHLRGICSDLKFNGFVWVVQGIDQVCENEQSLRVLQSGQVCVLGKFDAPVKQAAAQ